MAVNHLDVGSNPTQSVLSLVYQEGVMVTRQSHNLELVGSIPAPGTFFIFVFCPKASVGSIES